MDLVLFRNDVIHASVGMLSWKWQDWKCRNADKCIDMLWNLHSNPVLYLESTQYFLGCHRLYLLLASKLRWLRMFENKSKHPLRVNRNNSFLQRPTSKTNTNLKDNIRTLSSALLTQKFPTICWIIVGVKINSNSFRVNEKQDTARLNKLKINWKIN